jgi:SAM-dependent methyltransferase
VDLESDRRRAVELVAAVPEADVEQSVRWVFGRRAAWSRQQIERRTAQVMGAVARLQDACQGWLGLAAKQDGPLLDLGCGPGMLLAALPGSRVRLGVDVCLEWLVVARRLIAASGANAYLAAGHAEALPLPSASIGSLVALDVLEHVGNLEATLREVDRVVAPGGVFAAATPNRFSLAAEPHVFIWGVGWLPRVWQGAYVRWRTGDSYEFTRLLSASEIRRLLRRCTSLQAVIAPGPVPEDEIRRFSGRRRALAKTYNALLSWPAFRSAANWVGPFFHVLARKPPPIGTGAIACAR